LKRGEVDFFGRDLIGRLCGLKMISEGGEIRQINKEYSDKIVMRGGGGNKLACIIVDFWWVFFVF
jgi:hypothetical protein